MKHWFWTDTDNWWEYLTMGWCHLFKTLHWKGNVIILMKFLSLSAPKVVKMTTFVSANDYTSSKWQHFHFSIGVQNCLDMFYHFTQFWYTFKCRLLKLAFDVLIIMDQGKVNICHVIVQSVWWLVMAWRLSGTRTSTTVIMKKASQLADYPKKMMFHILFKILIA